MTQQESVLIELTNELKSTSATHQREITQLAGKVEEFKQQVEKESDQTLKPMKRMMAEELQKVEGTLVSEIRFLVQQLQSEVQQDIKAVQRNFQKTFDELLKES